MCDHCLGRPFHLCSFLLSTFSHPPDPSTAATHPLPAYVDWLATNPSGDITFPAWRASHAAGRFQSTQVWARSAAGGRTAHVHA